MANFKTLDIIGTYAGFEAALHGMRLPLKSNHKADSSWNSIHTQYNIGNNDYILAKKLCNAGSEHAKWMRQVPVWVEITADMAWWAEFDTYKIGTTANSTSTMHTIGKDNLEEAFDFPFGIDQDADAAFRDYLFALNAIQLRMNESKGTEWFGKYKQILKAMLPASFKYTRVVSLNYQVLQNMYRQRKNHTLPQWNTQFTEWVKTLPYSEFITGEWSV